MTKRKKVRTKKSTPVISAKAGVLQMTRVRKNLLAISLLAIVLFVVHGKSIMQGGIYPSGDVIDEIVNNQLIDRYEQQFEKAYWNPYIWGGVPNLFTSNKSPLSPDFYLDILSQWLSLPFVFFLLGGIGMYVLLLYWKFDPLLSFFGSLLFVTAPFYQSLIIVGHENKFQDIMYVPWIIWSLQLLLDRRKWKYVIPLAFLVALQIKASHFQIVFYTGFVLFIMVVFALINEVKQKAYFSTAKVIGMLVAAAMLSLLISAQPLLTTYAYSKQSVRAQKVVKLSSPKGQEGDGYGVGKAFVKPWSFESTELLSLLLPRALGGTSEEKVSGARVAGFGSDIVPSYWGSTPFSSSYYYAGLIPILLLSFGLLFLYKERVVMSMVVAGGLMIIWALGTNTEPFYSLCYQVVPFFRNFRTPPTSLSLWYVLCPILAMYGMRQMQKVDFSKDKRDQKKIRLHAAIFLAIGLLLLIAMGGFSFFKQGQNLSPELTDNLISYREDMFRSDLYIYGLLVVTFIALSTAYFYRKISFRSTVIILILLSFGDFMLVSSRYSKETVSPRAFVDSYLPPSSTIQFLNGDQASYRVLPFDTKNYGLPYYVQTIGGGYNMQMNKLSYEVTTNNLHHKVDGETQLNWNMLDILNVKYVVSKRKLPEERLSLEHTDALRGFYTYRYKFNRPRGFLVDKVEIITDDYDRLNRMNDAQLDLRSVALVEEPILESIQAASRGTSEVIAFTPNKVTYNVQTDRPGLFVMSDIYAPENQQVYIDGDLVDKVYKTNHMIQSVVVPKGFHTVEIRYVSALFKQAGWITNATLILLYGFILFWLYKNYSWQRVLSKLKGSV